jgi:hypothetical protein
VQQGTKLPAQKSIKNPPLNQPNHVCGFRVGDRVDAQIYGTGGTEAYFPGVIEKANDDGTFQVLFDTGARTPNVREDKISTPVPNFCAFPVDPADLMAAGEPLAKTWLNPRMRVPTLADRTAAKARNGNSLSIDDPVFAPQCAPCPSHARWNEILPAKYGLASDRYHCAGKQCTAQWEAFAKALYPLHVRRREIPHFSLHRRNFILLFYGVSETFLRRRKVPL